MLKKTLKEKKRTEVSAVKRDIKITQISAKLKTSREEAEKIFQEEICKKYRTDNVALAEAMYRTSLK